MDAIAYLISDLRLRRLFCSRFPKSQSVTSLSPVLSAQVIEALFKNPKNQHALGICCSLLGIDHQITTNSWAQEDAVRSALAAFGIVGHPIPQAIILKKGTSSSLANLGEIIYYEDNVIALDAKSIPGFEMINSDITGKAIFQKGNEQLTIYTANRLPLEKMLGVDLIYINESRGNILMIQYKMLEEVRGTTGRSDWIFRPDQQLRDEIARMRIPDYNGPIEDYRLNSNPFFFKFVKRKKIEGSIQSFYISLEHLIQLLNQHALFGSRGGIRISYNDLNGTYLREHDMLGLIRSGYIGTHQGETDALKTIIQKVAEGNKALVFAWQQKIQETAR